MPTYRRITQLLTTVAAAVGLCTAGSGCQSLESLRPSRWLSFGRGDATTFTAAKHPPQAKDSAAKFPTNPNDTGTAHAQFVRPQQAALLAPRAEVEWSVESPSQPRASMAAREVVGPDGSLPVGPYGTVKVSGMTAQQAADAVLSQVRPHVRDAKVRVRLMAPAGGVTQVSHRAATWSSDQNDARVVNSNFNNPQGGLPPAGPLLLNDPGPDLGPIAEGEAGFGAQPKLDPPKAPDPKGKDAKEPAAKKEKNGNGSRPAAALPPAVPPHGFHPPHGVPREGNRVTLPPYIIGPPDVLQIESLEGLLTQPVKGPHVVRPDGTVGVGAYGSAYVAGLTIEQAKEAIARVIYARLNPETKTFKNVLEGLDVDVLAYNSKVYYVITDGAGLGDQITRLPITGSETVLDALSFNSLRGGLFGLPPVASKRQIWVARPGPEGKEQILPVDYIGITQRGAIATNYQILPGDRVFVKADHLRTLNNTVDKVLSPIERILGVTLLGSQTFNSIRSGTTGF